METWKRHFLFDVAYVRYLFQVGIHFLMITGTESNRLPSYLTKENQLTEGKIDFISN
jgi:hypothetical protein